MSKGGEMMQTFYKGQQIAYVPMHARIRRAKLIDGGFEWANAHPYVEFGFVMSQRDKTVFCRYWRKGQPGTLRTTANSEGTPEGSLVPYKSVLDGDVWEVIQRIERRQ